MSMARAPDLSEMTITMEAISPEAEQQLDELCWESQKAVVRLLLERRILRSDCKRVQKIDGLQVYRLRVTRSVRLCFIFIEQNHCIVNLSSKSDFEHYCDIRQAAIPKSFVSLTESTVMKKLIARTSQTPVTQNSQVNNRTQQKDPLESSPVYLEAQRITFALIELLETGLEGFHSKIDDDIVAQVQLMKDEMDKNLQLLAGSQKRDQTNTEAKVAEMATCVSGIHQMVTTQSAALNRLSEQVKMHMQDLNTEARQHQDVIESSQQLIEKLTCCQDQLADLLANARQEESIHYQQLVKCNESLAEQVESVERSLFLCQHNIGRLYNLAVARLAAFEFHSGGNAEAIQSLIVRVRLLETVVQNLATEAIQPAKSLRRIRQWMKRRMNHSQQLFKQVLSRVSANRTRQGSESSSVTVAVDDSQG